MDRLTHVDDRVPARTEVELAGLQLDALATTDAQQARHENAGDERDPGHEVAPVYAGTLIPTVIRFCPFDLRVILRLAIELAWDPTPDQPDSP